MMIKSILFILLFSNLFSQFGDIEVTYEYNSRLIKDNKTYILEEFNELIKNYLKISTFSSENNDLNIPLKIHIFSNYILISLIIENNFFGRVEVKFFSYF